MRKLARTKPLQLNNLDGLYPTQIKAKHRFGPKKNCSKLSRKKIKNVWFKIQQVVSKLPVNTDFIGTQTSYIFTVTWYSILCIKLRLSETQPNCYQVLVGILASLTGITHTRTKYIPVLGLQTHISDDIHCFVFGFPGLWRLALNYETFL